MSEFIWTPENSCQPLHCPPLFFGGGGYSWQFFPSRIIRNLLLFYLGPVWDNYSWFFFFTFYFIFKTRQLHIVVGNILIIPLLRDTWLPIKFCTHLRPATKSTPEKINCWIQPAINQPIPYPASLFFPFLCTSPSFIDNVHIINVHHVIT